MTTMFLTLIAAALASCTKVPAQETDNPVTPPQTVESISFSSSDRDMERTFYWARNMALSYAHDDSDPVGYWYEAALPGRYAFCMRDASHQSIAAEMLGLSPHNFNIMMKFAENIREEMDWCSYWEIDKNNMPCSADYVDDANFWYNLNANFDVIFACWRLYEWTGDERYLKDETMSRFFGLSVNEYVGRWKLEPENLLSRTQCMNAKPETEGRYVEVRGLPSYVENYPGITNSSDLIASIYGGFEAYSQMLAALGNDAESDRYHQLAEEYRTHLEEKWWNPSINAYHTFWTKDGVFADGEGLTYMLWFNAAQEPDRIRGTVAKMMSRENWNIENVSHFPLLWFRYGYLDEAYDILRNVSGMYRSDYPEVSYGMIEGLVSGAMGIVPSASYRQVTTLPKLETDDTWMEVNDLPMLGGTVDVRHDGNTSSTFTNRTGSALTWVASFMGSYPQAVTDDGSQMSCETVTDIIGNTVSRVRITVEAGATASVSVSDKAKETVKWTDIVY